MTVVDSRDPDHELVIDLGPIEHTAGVLESQGEAVAERTRLLVLNEMLGNSFGIRDTDAADSYRNTAEVFGNVGRLLHGEMDRGRRILSSVSKVYRDADDANATALEQAADLDQTGGPR